MYDGLLQDNVTLAVPAVALRVISPKGTSPVGLAKEETSFENPLVPNRLTELHSIMVCDTIHTIVMSLILIPYNKETCTSITSCRMSRSR